MATLEEARQHLKNVHEEAGRPGGDGFERTGALLWRGWLFTTANVDCAQMWEIGPRGGVQRLT